MTDIDDMTTRMDKMLTSYRKGMEEVHASEQVEWLAFGYWQGRLDEGALYSNGNQFAQYVKAWWRKQGASRGLSHVSANLRGLYHEWKATQDYVSE